MVAHIAEEASMPPPPALAESTSTEKINEIKPRAYQQEMLAESLRQNTIVAVSHSMGRELLEKKD